MFHIFGFFNRDVLKGYRTLRHYGGTFLKGWTLRPYNPVFCL